MKHRRAPTLLSLLGLATALPLTATHAQQTVVVPVPDHRAAALAILEKTVEAERVKLGIPGLSLAVVEGDQVIFAKGFGFRDAARKLPVTPETLFAIGSSTKAFTALSVMQAVDDGKVSLDASPKKYLPYFRINDPETDAKITLRDLLCHRSGLTRTDLAMVSGKLDREELIRVAGEAKPAAKLGEKFQYQNIMFTAAGEAAARAEGRPFDKQIEDGIFKPLGMTHSTLSAERFTGSGNHAQGYSLKLASHTADPIPFHDIGPAAPAGAIDSSALDMTRWLRFLVHGDGTFEGKRLVSQAGFDEILKKQMAIAGTMNYGFGWFLREWRGEKVVEHGGNVDGFSTEVGFVPGKKLGFVLLSNVSYSPLQTSILQTVLTTLIDDPKPATTPAVTTAVTAAAAPVLAGDTAAKVDPKDEAGTYAIKGANFTIEVAYGKDGKLTATPSGQPTLPLENLVGRRYKIGAPAPDGFFVTFSPTKDNAQQTELFLEQPQGNATLVRQAAWTAPLTPDELLAKMIAAVGGEKVLISHQTRRVFARIDWENQGVTGDVVSTAALPNRSSGRITLRALNKNIGWTADYCDGVHSGGVTSFSAPEAAEGQGLARTLLEADFNDGLLRPDLYTMTIKRMDKINGEEAYVVDKTPKNGALPVTDYISTKTFLLLRRDSLAGGDGGPTVPQSTLYTDYRPTGGLLLPFTQVQTDEAMGRTVTRVDKIEWDVPVSPQSFSRASLMP